MTNSDQQAAAVKAGREAEAAGQPVIYIHGRPYAEPAETPATTKTKAQETRPKRV